MILNNISEKTLSNGLKVICLHKSGAPVVAIQVWYRTGSANETPGIRGISHFVEHLMFRGSKNIRSEEHAQRINAVGGHCNAFTAEDVTAYVNSVPRQYYESVLELEADRMANLLIDDKLFATEKRVVIEEFHTYMNNPVAKAMLEFRKEFYGDHPYGLSPLGTLEDLQNISVDDCYNYYKKWYTPSNAVLVAVGDLDVEQFYDAAQKYFGPIPPGELQDRAVAPPLKVVSNVSRMKRRVEFDVPVLIMGYPAPPINHRDAIALEILQMITSGGETSRLHREVVRNEAVAVMAGGMNQMLKISGMSMFFAAFTPDITARRVERAIIKQIEKIKANGISSPEMEKVKNATLTSRTFELYTAENICQRIGYSETIEGDYKAWVKRLDMLKNLDLDTLVEVANRYWTDTNRHVLYLKPKKTSIMLYFGGLIRRIFKN